MNRPGHGRRSPGFARSWFERRLMADRVFAIASFLAVFAVEIAIVQFAGPKPPLALDGQTYVLPIT